MAEDYITKLGPDLWIEIISKLPTALSVQSNQVTPYWKDMWKSIPSLDVAADNFKSYASFRVFVSGFLKTKMNGDLCKLRISGVGKLETALDRWIDAAVQKNVRDVEINRFLNFSLPRSLFTAKTLVRLSLSDCHLEPVSPTSLPSLKFFSLKRPVGTTTQAIKGIIEASVVLKEARLSFTKRHGPLQIEIKSVSLEVLELEFLRSFSGVAVQQVVIEAPLLVILRVTGDRCGVFRISNHCKNAMVDMDVSNSGNFSRAIQKCEELMITGSSLLEQYAELAEIDYAPRYPNLKRLQIRNFHADLLSVLLRMLTLSSSLQTLILSIPHVAEVEVKITDTQAFTESLCSCLITCCSTGT